MASCEKRILEYRRLAVMAIVALVASISLIAAFPSSAYGYFSKEAVDIHLGRTSLSLNAGKSANVSFSASMYDEEQLPGCGMAVCPQECDGLVTPDGVLGGCLNDAGWCTCGGSDYFTAYTNFKVSSSDSSVATATVESGTVHVVGKSAGTATITVIASLSQHADGYATIEVDVTGSASSGSKSSSSASSKSTSGGSVASASGEADNENAAEKEAEEKAEGSVEAAQSEVATEGAEVAASDVDVKPGKGIGLFVVVGVLVVAAGVGCVFAVKSRKKANELDLPEDE